jgi:serine/threonine-protein kinase
MGDPNSHNLIDEIYLQASELPRSEVAAFLAKACGADTNLRRKVERMLEAPDQFLDQPVVPGLDLGIERAANEAVRERREAQATLADRNMLYGIIALQMNFVSRDQLIKAMHDWVINKTTPIEKLMRTNGALGSDTMKLLTGLVDRHLEHHQGDAAASLRGLGSVGNIKSELSQQIQDPDVDQSLTYLRPGSSDSGQKSSLLIGETSSSGHRFQVLRYHDGGGMAKVSVARDKELNRDVAFKEIRDELSNLVEYQSRLIVEAEITGGLEHPGIVPVYGLGTYDDGRPFYAMRFVKGDNLKTAIQEYRTRRPELSSSERNMELRRLLRRFVDVCEAVNYAHSRSVLHRDLKPGNIMLGRYGETLVVDWGLAKAMGRPTQVDSEETQPILPLSGSSPAPTRGTVGTPAYMSPEQAQGELDELGPATDVFSLGATLYCLLAGRAPYVVEEYEDAKDKELKTLQLARHCQYPPPREIDKEIPAPLEAICMKAMSKEAGARYTTPQDLADDVERWLADEAVSAYPDPWTDRFARFIRCHRAASAGVSAVVVTALIGMSAIGVVSRNNYLRENAQNQKLVAANTQLTEANQRSREDFDDTRKMAYGLVKEAESTLAQTPGMEAYRKQITNLALETYERFFNRRSVDDPELQREMAQLYRYSANLDRLYSFYREAADKYASSVEILSGLDKANPKDPETRNLLAETLSEQAASLHSAGELNTSGVLLTEAGNIARGLRQEFPDNLGCQRTEARILLGVAGLDYEYARYPEALSKYKLAEGLFQQLVDSNHGHEADPTLLISCLNSQSMVLRNSGQAEDARAIAERAVQLADHEISQLNDPPRHIRNAAANARLELATVLAQVGVEDALQMQHLEKAALIWRGFAEDYPMIAFYRQHLARTLAAMAVLESRAGSNDQALEHINEAVDLMDRLIARKLQSPWVHEDYSEVLLQADSVKASSTGGEIQNGTIERAMHQMAIARQSAEDCTRLANRITEMESFGRK